MTPFDGNKYKIARNVAGRTQESWAEMLGVDVRSIGRYESGETLPSDETVTRMVEISGMTPLGYWHIQNKCRIAETELPEVERVPLPQAVVQVLCAISEFTESQYGLMKLAADGKISPDEQLEWEGIVARLDKVTKAVLQLKYAEGGTN